LAAALGVVDVATGVSGDDWLMEVATPEEVVDCTPDLSRVERLARSVVITAPGGEDAAITSRVFAPAIGIPEDQVTGSAHSGLAPWWRARLGSDFHAYQASSRGGRIRLRLSEHGVRLAGRAEIVGSGLLAR
jgi:predicted PhzF superfamily epimerase YddE/YHI9